ncbi:hypothetical protein ACJ73_00641 [Blastomyces percursus]|uniref:Uncharacterized protein n=1 Tax=Blastomyces percursus TaxID=1658174 RepID=A0A1J9RHB1_9EURO|nr:hypothetical protein ACJ73_00641 [Blastomyces percursus]
MLERRGITHDAATNDQQALEYLGRCIHGHHLTRPDIIYMDVSASDQTTETFHTVYIESAHLTLYHVVVFQVGRDVVHGPEITHIVRTQAPFSTDPKTKATPIIAMTNRAAPPTYPKYIWNLFTRDGEIRKPLKMADVLRAARSVKFDLVPATMLGYPGGNHSLPSHVNDLVRSPIWGPMPLRKYSGPRSLL